MTILITGATGQLGRLVVESLLERNVPAGKIVAAGRNAAKLEELAGLGVRTRTLDYSDPVSVREAMTGVDKVLLVSGNEPGSQRVPQHLNVIEAAKDAGVELLAYTSIANADTSTMALAADHQATEKALRGSGVPFAMLRNGWYLENYTDQLGGYLQHGSVFGSAAAGRVSAATRADLAEAAAAILLAEDQAGTVHELGGDEAISLEDLAREVSAATGQSVTYQDLPEADFARLLVGAGVPEPFARILADSDRGISRGELLVPGNDLATALGRPATTLGEAVRAAAGEFAAKGA
ncbi:SDR family oxidoreductase [Paeniglutamicibacter sp. NPDC091659]|uniref:SDR family oxidoreductase n=1 Tax=Paeniglutamicibacter sp. NPDC091659 TaxID=3364389 RepID=UPI0037F3E89A